MIFINYFLQPPASFLQTMEEYVRDAPTGQKEKVWKLQEVIDLPIGCLNINKLSSFAYQYAHKLMVTNPLQKEFKLISSVLFCIILCEICHF